MKTLKEIYETAKKKNKLYQKRNFAYFIHDFGNCGDEFFDNVSQYHKWIIKKKTTKAGIVFIKSIIQLTTKTERANK